MMRLCLLGTSLYLKLIQKQLLIRTQTTITFGLKRLLVSFVNE